MYADAYDELIARTYDAFDPTLELLGGLHRARRLRRLRFPAVDRGQ
jgi:hypothetical protein